MDKRMASERGHCITHLLHSSVHGHAMPLIVVEASIVRPHSHLEGVAAHVQGHQNAPLTQSNVHVVLPVTC